MLKFHTIAKSRFGLAIISLLAGYLFAGCGFVKSREAAEKVVNHHFKGIATNGFNVALGDYGPQFFQKITKEEWTKQLAMMAQISGLYRHHAIEGWRVLRTAGTYGEGATVYLRIHATYAKRDNIENFTLYKGPNETAFHIVAHTLSGDSLVLGN